MDAKMMGIASLHPSYGLDPIAQAQRTTAVLRTTVGRIVAGGARDLTPAQRALLGSGEVAARVPGVHAELTVLGEAARMGATPLEMAVTRAICPQCAAAIEAGGGVLTSPTTVVWSVP
jgi:tRNA(Arg) A34 adenosine deaminase TadA